jgi:hypothetical protein
METIAIISIIASVGTLLTIFSRSIKKSSCCACLNCETRTPQPSIQFIENPPPIPPNPTPQPSPQVVRNNNILKEVDV